MIFRIALAQMNPVVGDIRGNAKKILNDIRRAKSASADIILFPELALSGYPPEDLLLKPQFIHECEQQLEVIARQVKNIVAVIGLPIIESDSYNAAAVCTDSEAGEVYRKICLPNYGVFDEQRYFAAGNEVIVLDIDGGRFGLTICEDLWLSDGPFTDCVAEGGAHVILNISASPFHAAKTADRERMLMQRASDIGAYIAYCNMVGGQDELIFDGCSCVIDPDGKVIARAPSFSTDLLLADINIDTAIRHKLRDPRHREPNTQVSPFAKPVSISPVPYGVRTKKAPIQTRIESISDKADLTIAGIVTGIKDYASKNGFTKALIGISGGVDSALVAALACKSLGADNVLGLFMPSKFSSTESAVDARALADNLGLELIDTPIQDTVESFEKTLSPLFEGKARDVTEENIQARVRGTILMAVSNKFGHLLLATGNKSEMSVGYATLYGDMAGGFAPIKDLPKTTVYEICHRLNEEAQGDTIIPNRIIEKAPTAELRENQKDSDSLPDYDILDKILHLYVEQEISFDQIVEEGFDPVVVSQVIRMVNAGEYKRRQAPPGAKITSLAFGKDRRIPITNHFGRIEAPSAIPVRDSKDND